MEYLTMVSKLIHLLSFLAHFIPLLKYLVYSIFDVKAAQSKTLSMIVIKIIEEERRVEMTFCC